MSVNRIRDLIQNRISDQQKQRADGGLQSAEKAPRGHFQLSDINELRAYQAAQTHPYLLTLQES